MNLSLLWVGYIVKPLSTNAKQLMLALIFLWAFIFASNQSVFGQSIASWDFTSQPGNQEGTAGTATDNLTTLPIARGTDLNPASATNAMSSSGVTFTGTIEAPPPIEIAQSNLAGTDGTQAFTTGTGIAELAINNLTRGTALSPTNISNAFTSIGWNAGENRYISFGFNIEAGKAIDLTTFETGTSSSNTGPRDMALCYSRDGFSTNLATWTSQNAFLNQQIDLSSLPDLEGGVEFRIITTSTTAANGDEILEGGTFRITNYFEGSDTGDFRFKGFVKNGSGLSTSLSANPEAINFGTVNINASVADLTYTLTGENLTNEVSLEVAAPFSLSSNGTDFSQTLTLTPADLATPKTITVRLDNTQSGIANATISHNTEGASASVALRAIIFDPFNITEDFNTACSEGLPEGWQAFSVSGNEVWACTNFGRAGTTPTASAPFGIQMNGFADNAAQSNEDWIISPAYDLSNFDFAILSFWSRVAFSGPRLKLLISTNYVSGNPLAEGITWTALSDRFATSNKWTFSEEISLDDFKTSGVSIAFIYNSTPEEGAARWTIDDFALRSSATPSAPFLNTSIGETDYVHFGVVPVGGTSEKTYTFEFVIENGNQALEVLALEGFEFSKNGADFSPSLSYSPAEATSTQQVTVRFSPTSQGAFSGAITLQSGTLIQTKGFLSGATLERAATFDVVTWNVEWFGSNNNGPDDTAQQLQNVKTIIEELDADVYAFQEITNLTRFFELVNALPGYKGFASPAVSAGDTYANAQKLAFLYKTATVDSVRTQVLLQGVQPSSLVGYPSATDRFWASGRLPYLFEVRTNIEGIQKNIHLINMHTRSNGGGESSESPRYAMRKYDVEVLKDSLDAQFAAVPLIILGDYNDDLDETVADPNAPTVNTTESSFIAYLNDSNNYTPITLNLSNAGLRTFIGFSNMIDHVIISNELEEDWLTKSERVVSAFDVIEDYENTTSDHLPVKVRFVLQGEPVTALSPNVPRLQLVAYPNFVEDILKIKIQSQHSEIIEVGIYNTTGQLLYTQETLVGVGEQLLEINTEPFQIADGVLLLKVLVPSQGIYQKKILKK